MPSAHLAAAVLLVAAAGCLDEDPPPLDLDRMRIGVVWSFDQRGVEVSFPEIPCTGTESGFLGEDGKECESAPWTLTVDGVVVETTPMHCTAAHDGLFGPVDKHCSGGSAHVALPVVASEDVEILVSTGAKHTSRVLTGVRRTYGWTEEMPFRGGTYTGRVRVDEGLELGPGIFTLLVTRPDGRSERGKANCPGDDLRELALSLDAASRPNGVYSARVQAYIVQDDAPIAVTIAGMFTVAQ